VLVANEISLRPNCVTMSDSVSYVVCTSMFHHSKYHTIARLDHLKPGLKFCVSQYRITALSILSRGGFPKVAISLVSLIMLLHLIDSSC